MWKVTHEMELIAGEWQTRMKTKNIIGWSKFSTPFIFTIDDKGKCNYINKHGSGFKKGSSPRLEFEFSGRILKLVTSFYEYSDYKHSTRDRNILKNLLYCL